MSRSLAENLNILYQAEYASLIPRLAESTVFVSWASADEAAVLEDILCEENEHSAWLVEELARVGESPVPPPPDAGTTNLHFLQLDFVMPQVINDLKGRLALYSRVSPQLSQYPEASLAARKIAARHQAHLEALQKMAEGLAAG